MSALCWLQTQTIIQAVNHCSFSMATATAFILLTVELKKVLGDFLSEKRSEKGKYKCPLDQMTFDSKTDLEGH